MEDNYVKLFSSLTNLHKESDDLVFVPSFTVVEENSRFLLNIIDNIENKSSDEIKQFIQKNYTSLFDYRLFTESDASRGSMQRLFTNVKFLTELVNIIGTLKLENFHKVFLNRISYDYMSTNTSIDNPIYNLYFMIAGYVNSTLAIKLSSKLDVNQAKLLAMISNSSSVPEIRIPRINRFLVNCDNPILDTQAMIDIMFYLYDKFTDPIVYTLLETESCCNSVEYRGQYQRLINAIISILTSIPIEKMVRVLTSYGYVINSKRIENPPVKLKEIPDERLQEAIRRAELDPLIREIK